MEPHLHIIDLINHTNYSDDEKAMLAEAVPRRVRPAALDEARTLLAMRLPAQMLRALLAKLPMTPRRAIRG